MGHSVRLHWRLVTYALLQTGVCWAMLKPAVPHGRDTIHAGMQGCPNCVVKRNVPLDSLSEK